MTTKMISLKKRPSFTASGAKSLGGDRYEAPGKLTIKGMTRDVTATFTAKQTPSILVLEGSAPIKRGDFRVGDGVWADTTLVANEVALRFQISLKKYSK